MRKRVVVAMVVALAGVTVASAQSDEQRADTTRHPQGRRPHSRLHRATSATGETRPATTTFMGDTGLWFVPTGEVLPAKKWSGSAYRVNYDYNQGFTDVSNWPATFGVRPRRSGGSVRCVDAWSAASTATSVRSSCPPSPRPAAW